jgi:tyrosine-protein phosphatase SIW14
MNRLLALLACVVVIVPPLYYRVSRDRDYRNVREVVPGVLYRCGQLTPDGFVRVVNEYRVGTVISLRDTVSGNGHVEQFEDTYSRANGIAFYRFSPKSWSAPDGEVPAAENVNRFLNLMTDPNTKKPVLVHCFAGIHRTGGHVAAYRMDQCGWSAQDAMTEMRSMGTPRTKFDKDLLEFVQTFVQRQGIGRDRREK